MPNPLYQQQMLEAHYNLGLLKKISGVKLLDLRYYRQGEWPFKSQRQPTDWTGSARGEQPEPFSQRPVPRGQKYQGIGAGEPAHFPRLHLVRQNRLADPLTRNSLLTIEWLNLAPKRLEDVWKETLGICKLSIRAVYDAYELSLPYMEAAGRGLGNVLEGMAPLRPAQPDEPQTLSEAIESLKDIPKNLSKLPGQLEDIYEKGTVEQQIETSVAMGGELAGMLKGKPPKVKDVVAAGMSSQKADKLGKVLRAADEADLLAKYPELADKAFKQLRKDHDFLKKFDDIVKNDGLNKHTFEGEVIRKVDANGVVKYEISGIHSNKAFTDGTTRIKPGTQIDNLGDGFYKAKVEKQIGGFVNDQGTNWKVKAKKSTFFPDSWSTEKIQAEIAHAFKNKSSLGGNKYQGTTTTGHNVVMFLDESGKIKTAFPSF